MGVEYELKFAADEQQQNAIREAFPGAGQEFAMETTYYDTEDGALSRRHITLRRRYENGVSVCTLKTPAGKARGEWDCQEKTIEDAIPVLCKLSGWTELLSLTAAGVFPVCGAKFTRQARLLTLPEFSAELALDKGILTGGGKEIPLCEVELELKSGSAEALEIYAKAFAARFGLKPEKKSKFRRAMALVKGE